MSAPRFSPLRVGALVSLTALVTVGVTKMWAGYLMAEDQTTSVRLMADKPETHVAIPVHNQPNQLPGSAAARLLIFPQFTTEVTDRILSVSGKARIYETDQKVSYVWSLRIFQDGGIAKLFREHHYTDHPITLNEGRATAQPEFLDQVILPPGKYKVELTLYAVPLDFDFLKLKRGEDIQRSVHSLARRHRRVVVE